MRCAQHQRCISRPKRTVIVKSTPPFCVHIHNFEAKKHCIKSTKSACYASIHTLLYMLYSKQNKSAYLVVCNAHTITIQNAYFVQLFALLLDSVLTDEVNRGKLDIVRHRLNHAVIGLSLENKSSDVAFVAQRVHDIGAALLLGHF